MIKFDPIETLGTQGIRISNCLDDAEPFLLSTQNMEWDEDFRTNGEKIGYGVSLFEEDYWYDFINSAMLKAADIFLERTNRSTDDYKRIYKHYRIFKWETPMGPMGPHADGWEVNGETITPDISLVMYFTGDFEGGNLTFVDLNKKIKPKAGDIVVFDSNTLHAVESVLSGRRITTQLFLRHK
jgi:hypothetical protein